MPVCSVLGATTQSWKMQQVMAILSKTPSSWDDSGCTSAGTHIGAKSRGWVGGLCSSVRDDQPGTIPVTQYFTSGAVKQASRSASVPQCWCPAVPVSCSAGLLGGRLVNLTPSWLKPAGLPALPVQGGSCGSAGSWVARPDLRPLP